jgi:hypothetical protein
MIGFAVGMLYANASEWMIHKHVLHGRGKRRESWWSFHFHEHHQASRKHDMMDEDYERSLWGLHGQGKEALGIVALSAIHTPLVFVAPFFTAGVWYSAASYYRNHKRSHQDPAWAREHMPWHYDHHMGPNQDANWCVTWPWFDHVMGTRVRYAGTEREAADLTRKQERAARKAS